MSQLSNQMMTAVERLGKMERSHAELLETLDRVERMLTENFERREHELKAAPIVRMSTAPVSLAELDAGLKVYIIVRNAGAKEKAVVAPAVRGQGFQDQGDGTPLEYHVARTDKDTQQGPKLYRPLSEVYRTEREAESVLFARHSSNPKTSAVKLARVRSDR